MKLVSFGPKGLEKPGVVVNDTIVVDLLAADPSLPGSIRQILADDALGVVRRINADAASLPEECKHA
ncbi:MAG: hypothetical protein KAT30_07275 [Candidatus Krumholzibacteria bacterium]|nr:hypothetical protein [Candidatus Krumholzibacteria bacterium]